MKDKLRRLEQATQGILEYIDLETGERFWYEPMQAAISRFLWTVECAKASSIAERPEAPPIVEAVLKAADRRAAFDKVFSERIFDLMPFDPETLVEEGRLEHVSMLAGSDDPDDAFVEDLSGS